MCPGEDELCRRRRQITDTLHLRRRERHHQIEDAVSVGVQDTRPLNRQCLRRVAITQLELGQVDPGGVEDSGAENRDGH